jgi:branched-subunit amino acid transport protein
MDGHAYIGELFSAVFFVIAGARLLGLSRRTRETPELLLGLAFVVSGIALLLYLVPYLHFFESLWDPFIFAGRVGFIPVSVMIALFTRGVFRPSERWATWLVWGIAALHTVGVTGSALVGDWEGYSISSGWFWLEWAGYTLPMAWTGLEALAQYAPARRRVRLGLCGPLVCNRMLLWGLFGALQVGLSILVLFQYAAFEEASVFTEGWDRLYGVFSMSSVAMIWFAFFPPAFYRRWVNGVAPVES